MNLLVEEKLLTYDFGHFEWKWLEESVQSKNLADNVAEAVYKRLKRMDRKDFFVLQVASTIGNSFEESMIEFVLQGLEASFANGWSDVVWSEDIGWTLERLVDAGVIVPQYEQGRYSFSHDQIQAAAFRLIPHDRKCVLQLAIGQRLIEGMNHVQRNQFLFLAVELCIAGIDLMSEEDKLTFAFSPFLARDMALKQGAFESALRFLDVLIEALGETPFNNDEELALPVFCGAVEAAYALSSLN